MSIRRIAATCILLIAPALAFAREGELNIPSFAHLQNKAVESVDITIGSWPLRFAAAFADDGTEEGELAQELLRGLKSIHVRSYSFASDNYYSRGDIEAVRSQLTGPKWMPLAQVHKRKAKADVDIYVSMDGDQPTGLAVVAIEPREFTILSIVGRIDPKKIGRLSKHLHLSIDGLDDRSDASEETSER